MVNALLCTVLSALILMGSAPSAQAQNPFLAGKNHHRVTAEAPSSQTAPNSFLLKISLWQQQLKQKMAALIREARTGRNLIPLLTLFAFAFGYGLLHAAGPGHGKAVAMSFILSRQATIGSGLLLGVSIAFIHGLSGVICVLGLHYIVQKSISGTLGTVSSVTQIVSFSLITLLGLGIVLKNAHSLWAGDRSQKNPAGHDPEENRKTFLPWAMSVGLVPCPGVMMVLLYCLSMDFMALGLILVALISLGMAATISIFVIAVIVGKGISLKAVSTDLAETVDHWLGLVSGVVVTGFALIFLLATLKSLQL